MHWHSTHDFNSSCKHGNESVSVCCTRPSSASTPCMQLFAITWVSTALCPPSALVSAHTVPITHWYSTGAEQWVHTQGWSRPLGGALGGAGQRVAAGRAGQATGGWHSACPGCEGVTQHRRCRQTSIKLQLLSGSESFWIFYSNDCSTPHGSTPKLV